MNFNNNKLFLIAEVGGNHNGNYELAKKAIEDIEQIITSSDELILINGGSKNINHPLINKNIKDVR